MLSNCSHLSRRDNTLLTVGVAQRNLRREGKAPLLPSLAEATLLSAVPAGLGSEYASCLARRLKSTVNKMQSLCDFSEPRSIARPEPIRREAIRKITNFNVDVKYIPCHVADGKQ
jgi:hypothetical protein